MQRIRRKPKNAPGDTSGEEDMDSRQSGDKPDLDKSGSGLKLVLKVAGSASKSLDTSTMGSASDDSDGEKKVKSATKRRKQRKEPTSSKKRSRGDEVGGSSDDESSRQQGSKVANIDELSSSVLDGGEDNSQSGGGAGGGGGRVARVKRRAEDRCPLELCLEHLQRMLERKDTKGFFAFPVTDSIAPGYSSIIDRPMDFSTMAERIERAQYTSIAEYKADYELMMNNCIAYNHPDTVYYKDAKRLLLAGQKLMSKEGLQQLKRTLPCMHGLTVEELGFVDDTAPAQCTPAEGATDAAPGAMDAKKPVVVKDRVRRMSMIGRFEAVPDDLTPEEILAQATAAAAASAAKLSLRAPNSKMGFLRRREDGTTTLNILNPDNDGIVSETEKIVDLGTLVGRLTSGTGTLLTTKEDRRNRVNPVSYLSYGAFCSYAPVYDSATANISKDDSDLLLSTYCDETGIQYAASLRHFVKDSGDYAVSMVDNLLDLLTSGQHSKTMELLKQQDEEREREQLEAQREAERMSNAAGATADEQTSNIDMSFLSSMDTGADADNSEVQAELSLTSQLISDLHKTQYGRLSQSLPQHLSMLVGPSAEEEQIAHSVTSRLTQLVKQVNPCDVIGARAIRSVLGITDQPPADSQWQLSDDGTTNQSQPSNTDADLLPGNEQNSESCVPQGGGVDFDQQFGGESFDSQDQSNLFASLGQSSVVEPLFRQASFDDNGYIPTQQSQDTESVLAVSQQSLDGVGFSVPQQSVDGDSFSQPADEGMLSAQQQLDSSYSSVHGRSLDGTSYSQQQQSLDIGNFSVVQKGGIDGAGFSIENQTVDDNSYQVQEQALDDTEYSIRQQTVGDAIYSVPPQSLDGATYSDQPHSLDGASYSAQPQLGLGGGSDSHGLENIVDGYVFDAAADQQSFGVAVAPQGDPVLTGYVPAGQSAEVELDAEMRELLEQESIVCMD